MQQNETASSGAIHAVRVEPDGACGKVKHVMSVNLAVDACGTCG